MRNRNRQRFLIFCSVAFATLWILAGGISAQAGTIIGGNVMVDITGYNTVTSATMTDQVLIPIQLDGSFEVIGAVSNMPMWEGTVSADGNIDPNTGIAFGVKNIAAVPVEYTFAITVPIAPILSGTLHGGSTGGSVTDESDDGLGGVTPITSTPGTPFYAGKIDGLTVLEIYPDPFGWSFAFDGQTVNILALNPGLPGPTIPSGPALVSIGIEHKFTLSPGDSMAVSSFFIVEPVPEPSSIVLAVMGGLGLLLLARRRRIK